MTDGEDWLMRPVLKRMCLYESLLSGAVDLADIARMNEALDIQAENQARVEESYRNKT